MQKNVTGQKFIVFAFNITTNSPAIGESLNITGNIQLDGGTPQAIDDTNPTELGNGYYAFDALPSETNAENILINPVCSTSNIQVIGVPALIITTPSSWPDKITAIKAVTDLIPDAGAMTSIAQEVTLAAVGSKVDLVLEDTGITLPAGQGALSTQIGNLNDFNPATDIVAHVTLVDTVTTNTDMRGTDGAALESSIQAAIADIAGLQTDITEILGYTNGNWEIDKVNKQMIFKTGTGVEISRFNLFKDGIANSDEPDQRVKV